MSIREDYRQQEFISYDEAAHLSGLSNSRIKSLASEIRNGRRLFAKGNAVGPYRIDRESFEEYLRTGVASGPAVPPERPAAQTKTHPQ